MERAPLEPGLGALGQPLNPPVHASLSTAVLVVLCVVLRGRGRQGQNAGQAPAALKAPRSHPSNPSLAFSDIEGAVTPRSGHRTVATPLKAALKRTASSGTTVSMSAAANAAATMPPAMLNTMAIVGQLKQVGGARLAPSRAPSRARVLAAECA